VKYAKIFHATSSNVFRFANDNLSREWFIISNLVVLKNFYATITQVYLIQNHSKFPKSRTIAQYYLKFWRFWWQICEGMPKIAIPVIAAILGPGVGLIYSSYFDRVAQWVIHLFCVNKYLSGAWTYCVWKIFTERSRKFSIRSKIFTYGVYV